MSNTWELDCLELGSRAAFWLSAEAELGSLNMQLISSKYDRYGRRKP